MTSLHILNITYLFPTSLFSLYCFENIYKKDTLTLVKMIGIHPNQSFGYYVTAFPYTMRGWTNTSERANKQASSGGDRVVICMRREYKWHNELRQCVQRNQGQLNAQKVGSPPPTVGGNKESC